MVVKSLRLELHSLCKARRSITEKIKDKRTPEINTFYHHVLCSQSNANTALK